MESSEKAFQVYEELAEREALGGGAAQRDRFLVLAADAAWTAEQPAEAERLRQRLVHGNPHHLLKPYHSWPDALQSPDIRSYLSDLRKNCPVEKAEQLLKAKPRVEPAPPPKPAAPEEPAEFPPVLRLQSPPEKAPPAPRANPALPVLKPAAAPPARPTAASRPQTLPAPFTAAAPASEAAAEDDGSQPTPADFWIATTLFFLLLGLALALAAYTLAWPFLG